MREEPGRVREQVGGDGRDGRASPAAAGCRIGSVAGLICSLRGGCRRANVTGCRQQLAGVTQELRGSFCRPRSGSRVSHEAE